MQIFPGVRFCRYQSDSIHIADILTYPSLQISLGQRSHCSYFHVSVADINMSTFALQVFLTYPSLQISICCRYRCRYQSESFHIADIFPCPPLQISICHHSHCRYFNVSVVEDINLSAAFTLQIFLRVRRCRYQSVSIHIADIFTSLLQISICQRSHCRLPYYFINFSFSATLRHFIVTFFCYHIIQIFHCQ